MSRIALVAARATNGVIGNGGSIPWRIPEDMRRFREITMGKPCVMGRKTWESLPGKPLTGRLNIVVTRDPHYRAAGAVVVQSVGQGVARAQSESVDEVAIIGGEEIYRATLPCADVVYLTEVLEEFPGDAHFPAIDLQDWRETAREEHISASGLNYVFVTLERIRDRPPSPGADVLGA